MKAATKSKTPRKGSTVKRSGSAGTKPAPTAPAPEPAPGPSAPAGPGAAAAPGVRVRMFRVGFGDFFLLSITTTRGQSHVLIDCGVHAKDLGSIREAVTQMAQDCDN